MPADAPPKRTWDTGMVRRYRPMPRDFREVYLRLGWDKAIEEHYRTNYRCIARWIEEAGGDTLRAARSAISGHPHAPHRRSKRYILGRTLAPPQYPEDREL